MEGKAEAVNRQSCRRRPKQEKIRREALAFPIAADLESHSSLLYHLCHCPAQQPHVQRSDVRALLSVLFPRRSSQTNRTGLKIAVIAC